MLRIALCCLAIGGLAPVLPQGCPWASAPTEAVLTERNTIATEATAPTSASVGETVTLAATATADVDGGAISYHWLQAGGSGVRILDPNQANASLVAPSLATPQMLRFLVTTTNERGDAGRAEVQVLVAADPNFGATSQNAPASGLSSGPVARAGSDREVAAASTVTLNASNSRGDTLTYLWEQVAGPTVSLQNANTAQATFEAPAYDPATDNRLEFKLEVRDRGGRHATDQIVITVKAPSPSEDTDPTPRFRIKTSLGDIVVELDRTKAPKTVENFQQYVQDKFYDGTLFHRVIPDFVIQGGGFEPGLVQKDTRDPIVNESSNGLKNVRGTIAMARTSDPDSATSQFYINLKDNPGLDFVTGQPGYAVFGHVVDGLGVVDAIAAVLTETRQGFTDVPVTDVVILSVERVAK